MSFSNSKIVTFFFFVSPSVFVAFPARQRIELVAFAAILVLPFWIDRTSVWACRGSVQTVKSDRWLCSLPRQFHSARVPRQSGNKRKRYNITEGTLPTKLTRDQNSTPKTPECKPQYFFRNDVPCLSNLPPSFPAPTEARSLHLPRKIDSNPLS